MRRGPSTLFENWDGIRSDYDAAKTTKFRRKKSGLPLNGAGSDWHYRNINDLLRMIEWARDFDRNSPIIAQAVDRVCDNVQPELYALEPMTGDKKVDDDLKARFEDWANDADQCDSQGRRTFREIGWQSLRHVILDGDCSLLPNEDGFLETMEAHRMRGPTSSAALINVTAPLGIDANKYGKPTAYYYTKADYGFGGSVKVADVARYLARDEQNHRQVFHLLPQRRFSQNRGVTFLAPVFDMIGFHDDLQFAQLVKAQVSACFAIFEEIQPDKGIRLPGDDLAQIGSRDSETLTDGQTRTLESIGPGMRIASRNKLTGFSPNVPNAEFFQHVKLILTFISINLGIPVHVLLLDPSDTNFTGWRGAMDQAREGFKVWQRWLIDSVYSEVYRWKVRQWLAEDLTLNRASERRKSTNILAHRWKPTSWGYIEPLKDASADLLRLRSMLASPSRIHSSNGQRWDEEVRTTIRDLSFAIVAAKQEAESINKQFPEDAQQVTWRDLCPLPTASGVNLSLAFSDSKTESEPVEQTKPKQPSGSKA